jgi:cytochrome oxidase Cu insertion factor (SCO1/SenC/PrrC family)
LPGGTGTGAGGEGTGEDAAQKEAALQQYQQYLQRIKTQQQQKTQELVDPKSVYYLTPEEQAARGYINPAELYESITPFKRGGLASMKRNAKWQ